MSIWFHSAILAVSLAATVAVGIASAAISVAPPAPLGAKSDRLTVVSMAAPTMRTVETRLDGTSILTRVPLAPSH